MRRIHSEYVTADILEEETQRQTGERLALMRNNIEQWA